MSTIKIRAKESNGVVTVKALMKHPMETGKRKDKKTGDNIPAHFIQEISGKANGSEGIVVHWGPAVSKNPYLTFAYNGSIRDKPIVKCVYQTDVNENKFIIIKPKLILVES